MMAGTRPVRRVRRAAPLPNSVRGSAAMRTSGTVVTPLVRKIWRRREMLARGPRGGPGQAAALQTKTRTQARWAESLAGYGHTRACPPAQGSRANAGAAPGISRARRYGCGTLAVISRARRAPDHGGQLNGRLGAVEPGGQLDGIVLGARRGILVLGGQLGRI